MRVLTYSNCPLDVNQGSGYVTLGYANQLRARGHTVDVVGPPEFEWLQAHSRAKSYRQAAGMAAHAMRRAATGAYDLVEFYGGEAWLAIRMLTRIPGRRFLVVSHSNGLEPHMLEALQHGLGSRNPTGERTRWFQLDQSRLFEQGFRHADAVVMVSNYDRDYALQHRYQVPERLLAIDNPLSDEALVARSDAPASQRRQIVFVGAWLALKGTALIAHALPAVLRKHPGWSLALVGVGHDFEAARWLPADVLDRVKVFPKLPRTHVLEEMSRSAIVLAPSIFESFGLAAAEGMAQGAALVATRTGFAYGLKDREEAMLVEPQPAALERAVADLIKDPALLDRVAKAGQQRVQALTWRNAGDALDTAYRAWRG